ncbi:hypothetical protein [Actinomycetospora soli]|uniref:hypothetical protein n=1 Tax=Actinomycetospora soli TaxID=2893887 RepID=UPI001E53EC34|nr:hypothetical protein [Actinomycetospora soli]MCD2186403.1 hypothetical protein [Actinomycetospora soli]
MDRTSWIRITGTAGVVGAVCWSVKWVAIAVQGYSGGELDVVAFFLGLAGVLVGSCSLTLQLTAGRSRVTTIAGCLVGAVVALLAVPGLSIVSSGLFGDETFLGSEGGLLLLALVVAVIGVTGLMIPGRSRALAS